MRADLFSIYLFYVNVNQFFIFLIRKAKFHFITFSHNNKKKQELYFPKTKWENHLNAKMFKFIYILKCFR